MLRLAQWQKDSIIWQGEIIGQSSIKEKRKTLPHQKVTHPAIHLRYRVHHHFFTIFFCRTGRFSSVRHRCPVFHLSIRLSVHPPVCPFIFPFTIYVDPGFYVHLNDFSLKPLHLWISNFTCSMIRLQGFRPVKVSLFLRNGLVYLAEILYVLLVRP